MDDNKNTKYIEDPDLFVNASNPQGDLGEKLLDWMTVNHESLSRWGISHLDIKKEDIILDIGCGSGANLARFLEKSEKVCGIDYSQLAVEKSAMLNQQAIDEGKCEIVQASVSNMPYDDESFDIITAFETVYFWPDIGNDLKETRRVLKDDGIILICNEAVPKPGDKRQNELVELLGMNIYSEDELDELLRQAGFSDVLCFLNEGRDSVTNEHVTWLCVIARK